MNKMLALIALPIIGFGQITNPSVIGSSGDSYYNAIRIIQAMVYVQFELFK